MTLFEECREVLGDYFSIMEGQAKRNSLDIFNQYPQAKGNVDWSKINYSDYMGFDELLEKSVIESEDVFVLADDAGIPIFKTRLTLIAENVYDVTSLSPKLFIFNDEIIIHPLFPTDMVRLGRKGDDI
jgi:hypothetical protein